MTFMRKLSVLTSLLVATVAHGQTGTATAQALNTNLQGLAGCSTAGNVLTPAGADCVPVFGSSTVGGIIGGGFNNSGLFAGTTASWFGNASTASNLVFPYSLYLGNFSTNVSTTIAANGTALWLITVLPSITVTGPAILTFPPGTTAGTDVSRSSFVNPIPVSAWTTTEFTRSAAAITGAATGGAYIFSAEVLGTTIQPLGVYMNTTVALSTTTYMGLAAGFTQQSTEGNAGIVIPWANGGTVSDLVGYTSGAQPASGALVGTLRVNGATPGSPPTFTVAVSAAAGIYPDLTHTASLTQGQWIDVQMANAATAVSGTVIGVTAALTPAAPATGLLIFPVGTTAVANDYYAPYFLQASATETTVRGPIPRAGTIKNLYCIYTSAPGTNAGAFTLVKNGTPTSLSAAIPTTGSGVQIQTERDCGARGDGSGLRPGGCWVHTDQRNQTGRGVMFCGV